MGHPRTYTADEADDADGGMTFVAVGDAGPASRQPRGAVRLPAVQDASVCWDPCTGTVTITARVVNGSPGASVETDLEARAGNSVLANVPVPALEAGVLSDELQLTIPGTAFDGGQVVLSVDPQAVVVECDEGDNEVVLADPR